MLGNSSSKQLVNSNRCLLLYFHLIKNEKLKLKKKKKKSPSALHAIDFVANLSFVTNAVPKQ